MNECSRRGHNFQSYKIKEMESKTEFEIRCRRCGKTPEEVRE